MTKIDDTEIELFVHYLETTLIPGLKEGGFEATADDFTTASRYLAQLLDYYREKST